MPDTLEGKCGEVLTSFDNNSKKERTVELKIEAATSGCKPKGTVTVTITDEKDKLVETYNYDSFPKGPNVYDVPGRGKLNLVCPEPVTKEHPLTCQVP
jgi:hypothetical protein